MTQTQFIIFIVVTLVAMGGAISTLFIDYMELIGHLFRDRPHKGRFEVWNGKGWDICKGRWVAENYLGQIWNYRFDGKTSEVRTGPNYPYQYIKRSRLIRCKPGQLIALPLGPTDQLIDQKGEYIEPQFGEEEIGLQTYGWALVEYNKSIRGRGAQSVLIWILVGIIVVAGVVGVWYFTSQKNKTTTPGTNKATPTATATPTKANNQTIVPLPMK